MHLYRRQSPHSTVKFCVPWADDLEELCHQLSETAVFVSESVQRAARDVYLRSWTITNTVRRCWGVFMIAAPSILTVLTYLHRHIG